MARLVGVTGTNGKTSTTRWVAAALRASSAGPVLCLDSVAWRIGDRDLGAGRSEAALDAAIAELANEDGDGDAGVIELTSHALGTGFGRALAFKVGVFTNLTPEHLDLHGSLERYLACKAQLFVRLAPGSTAVLNASDDAGRLLSGVLPPGVARIAYAYSGRGPTWCDPDVAITDVVVGEEGTSARLCAPSPIRIEPGSLKAPGHDHCDELLDQKLMMVPPLSGASAPLSPPSASSALRACGRAGEIAQRLSSSTWARARTLSEERLWLRDLTTSRGARPRHPGRVRGDWRRPAPWACQAALPARCSAPAQ